MTHPDVLPSDSERVGGARKCECGELAQPLSRLGQCFDCARSYRLEKARAQSEKQYAAKKAARAAELKKEPARFCECGCGKSLRPGSNQKRWATVACGVKVRERANRAAAAERRKQGPSERQRKAKERYMPRPKVEESAGVVAKSGHSVTVIPTAFRSLRCPASGIMREFCGCNDCGGGK